MSVQITRLCSTLVASSATAVYTVGASTRTRIDAMTAYNSDTVARTLTIYLVASGGSAGASTTLVANVSIAAGASYRVKEVIGHVLQSGGKIYAAASVANVIALYASGVEVT